MVKYARVKTVSGPCYGLVEGKRINLLDGDPFGPYRLKGISLPLEEVEFLPPVEPGKIIAIGLNYADHALEKNRPLPEEPLMFLVSPTAVIAHGREIVLPSTGHLIEYEGELAVVIKKTTRAVSEQEALNCVLGYTCANDVSDRDLQKKDGQFTRAKSFHTFKPLGPFLVTGLDPDNLAIRLAVNGETRQNSSTRHMIFNVARLIHAISMVMTLLPGDVILTGTPAGVGPLRPGNTVAVEIEGIGTLCNRVTSI